MLAAAEQRKTNLRGKVAELRKELADLIRRNEEQPPELRLPPEAFEVDPDLRSMVEVRINIYLLS